MQDIYQFAPLWGTWEIDCLIGEGASGKVYRAKRFEYGKLYYSAIKHISIPSSDAVVDSLYDDGIVNDASSLEQYLRSILEKLLKEVEINVSLKGYTNIVSYEDHLVVQKTNSPGYDVFIRMELLTGLPELLKEKAIEENTVAKLGIDICSALEILKQHSILHRDIKPGNIFVNENGDFKLGDFGVSRSLENAMCAMTRAGTPSYMPPEINTGGTAGYSSDIYSLGIVLYRLCNGGRPPFAAPPPAPFSGDDNEMTYMRRMRGEKLPPPAFASRSLAGIIIKACEFLPKNRYNSPTEFKNALMGKAPTEPEELDKTVSADETLYQSPAPSEVSEVPAETKKPIPLLAIIFAAVSTFFAIALIITAVILIATKPQPAETQEMSLSQSNADYGINITRGYTLDVNDYDVSTGDGYYFKINYPKIQGKGSEALSDAIDNDYGYVISQLRHNYKSFEVPIMEMDYEAFRSNNLVTLVIRATQGIPNSEPYSLGNAYHYDEESGRCLDGNEYLALFGYDEEWLLNQLMYKIEEYNETHSSNQVNLDYDISFQDLMNTYYFDQDGVVQFCFLQELPLSELGQGSASAPNETTSQHSTEKGHRYEVIIDDLTWEEAASECERRGGHLVTVSSQSEMDKIISLAEKADVKYVWLGGYTYRSDNGDLYAGWVTGEPFTYQLWCPNEPSGSDYDGSEENCIVLWYLDEYDWTWNDINNDPFGLSTYHNNIAYICEYGDGY
ncbi:MAG: protein kinase [Oscillospiraceae bacterium]